MANILLVSQTLQLFHSPKETLNKFAKYGKPVKCLSYFTWYRKTTSTYFLTHCQGDNLTHLKLTFAYCLQF